VQRYENTAVGGLRLLLVITFLECCSGCVVTGYFCAHTLHAVSLPMQSIPHTVFQKSVCLLQVGSLRAQGHFVEHVVVVQHFTFHRGNKLSMQQCPSRLTRTLMPTEMRGAMDQAGSLQQG
jgi:hypothetical protein